MAGKKTGGIYSFFYEDEAELYEPIMAVRQRKWIRLFEEKMNAMKEGRACRSRCQDQRKKL